MTRSAMRLTRRKILNAIPLLGSTVLAACRVANTGGGRQGGAEEQGNISAKPGTVVFWHWGTLGADNYFEGFRGVVEQFMQKYPSIKVEHDMPTGYWDKMVASIAAGTAPDVFLINSTRNREWANNGTLNDISAFLNKDRAAARDVQAVIKVFTDWYTVQGKLYGIPWDYSTIATVFNLAHLREAGLQLPAQLGDRWNWELTAEYAQKLTRREGERVRWGFTAIASTETGWYNFVVANGGAMFDQEGKKCTIASPQSIEATQFLVDMIHKSRISPTRQELSNAGGVVKAMQSGVASITTNGDWNFKPLADPSVPLEWDVSYIPRSPRTNRTASIANLRGLVQSPGTKVPEQAWLLMTFMLRKEIQDTIPSIWQEVPARLDSALEHYTDPAKAGPPQNRRALADSIKSVTPLPAHDWTPITRLSETWTPILNDMWDGKVGVSEGLRRMQDDVQRVIDEFQKGK